jgi:hypothetical protein
MSKKHFEILAYRLAMVEPTSDELPGSYYAVWKRTVEAVAQACGDCNERFDRERFLAACRFDYWKTHKPPKGV